MENKEDVQIASEADDIASVITRILVKGFHEKEGRVPTSAEMEQLFEELTEDRVEAMMSGQEEVKEVAVAEKGEAEEGGEEDDASQGEEEAEGAGDEAASETAKAEEDTDTTQTQTPKAVEASDTGEIVAFSGSKRDAESSKDDAAVSCVDLAAENGDPNHMVDKKAKLGDAEEITV